MEKKNRQYYLDNLRFLLIFLVVFAHFLEVCPNFFGRELLYQVIYSFHMPAFLFLFGCFAKFSPKRILVRWCVPYVIFQTVYLLFERYVLGWNTGVQYTTPYWILWYLLVCIFYQLLIPLVDTENKLRQTLTVIVSVILALSVGYADTIGYPLSLSRFFVFLPWFLIGFYCKKNKMLQQVKTPVCFIPSVIVVVASVFFLHFADVSNGLLYGSYSYAKCGGTLCLRAVLMLISLAWVVFLLSGFQKLFNRKISFVTTIGQNTWPIFLLHGFLVKALPAFGGLWWALLATIVILLLFGNRFFQKLLSFDWHK